MCAFPAMRVAVLWAPPQLSHTPTLPQVEPPAPMSRKAVSSLVDRRALEFCDFLCRLSMGPYNSILGTERSVCCSRMLTMIVSPIVFGELFDGHGSLYFGTCCRSKTCLLE